MEETDQDFYSIIDAIPSLLEEGQIDQAIILWETTFDSLGPQLSIEGKLSAMSFYAQALHYAELEGRAREVDLKIEEIIAEVDEEDISQQFRKNLLRNIAERWGIEVGELSDTSASPGPPSEASAQTQDLSRESSPLTFGGERRVSPRLEQEDQGTTADTFVSANSPSK